MEPFEPIPGKPPRKVVIDRQRKLFSSLDIEILLIELVSSFFIFTRQFQPQLFKSGNPPILLRPNSLI